MATWLLRNVAIWDRDHMRIATTQATSKKRLSRVSTLIHGICRVPASFLYREGDCGRVSISPAAVTAAMAA
jgi:hypothetical protein